jgi:hypothetical protein
VRHHRDDLRPDEAGPQMDDGRRHGARDGAARAWLTPPLLLVSGFG